MNQQLNENCKTLINRMGGDIPFHMFIDDLYAHLLEDYRINRFFNATNIDHQKHTLESLLTALFHNHANTAELTEQLDDYFSCAFARSKRKSFVAGSDWNFFGEIIEQDEPNTEQLSDAHFFLLKLMPDDENYDAFLENLHATLIEEGKPDGLCRDVMELAEYARDAILGRKSIH